MTLVQDLGAAPLRGWLRLISAPTNILRFELRDLGAGRHSDVLTGQVLRPLHASMRGLQVWKARVQPIRRNGGATYELRLREETTRAEEKEEEGGEGWTPQP